jgi:hypothetical protein
MSQTTINSVLFALTTKFVLRKTAKNVTYITTQIELPKIVPEKPVPKQIIIKKIP